MAKKKKTKFKQIFLRTKPVKRSSKTIDMRPGPTHRQKNKG